MTSIFLSRNFTLKELSCRCGRCEPIIVEEFVRKLQRLRDEVGFPLNVTSAYRCPEHNKISGGAPDSMHLKGVAVDIDTSSMSQSDRYDLVFMAMKTGFRGVGIASNFIHLDTRTSNIIWNYK